MSAPAFAWALERGASLSLKPAERLVLLYLADMANGERVCWPGQPTIMRFTGLKMTTVRAAVRQLAAKHLIAVEAQPGIVTRYHILRPVTPPNGHGAESVTPTKTAQGHPVKMAHGTPMKGDGDPVPILTEPRAHLALTPPNGHTDPSYTQEVDPKRRASAPEASQVLSFPGNGTPQPEPPPSPTPPTRNTTLSSVPLKPPPEDDNPPVDPGVALAVLDDLKRSLRMRAYPPRAAVMSPDEMATAACGMRHVRPAYLPDDVLAALRADARRSLVRRAVVS